MNIIKYPSESDVNKAICDNEPLLVLISFDGETVITSQIDEAVEHHILLMKTGFKDTDIDKFFEVIDSCKGRVELVTGEGDRLNLKSKLSQYVSLANIFSGGEIPELEIVAYEKEDIDKLLSFMING